MGNTVSYDSILAADVIGIILGVLIGIAIGGGWGILVGIGIGLGGLLLGWFNSDAYTSVVDFDLMEWAALVMGIFKS